LSREKTEQVSSEKRDIAELFLVVLMLVAQSNARKRVAEKIIDTFFGDHD